MSSMYVRVCLCVMTSIHDGRLDPLCSNKESDKATLYKPHRHFEISPIRLQLIKNIKHKESIFSVFGFFSVFKFISLLELCVINPH